MDFCHQNLQEKLFECGNVSCKENYSVLRTNRAYHVLACDHKLKQPEKSKEMK